MTWRLALGGAREVPAYTQVDGPPLQSAWGVLAWAVCAALRPPLPNTQGDGALQVPGKETPQVTSGWKRRRWGRQARGLLGERPPGGARGGLSVGLQLLPVDPPTPPQKRLSWGFERVLGGGTESQWALLGGLAWSSCPARAASYASLGATPESSSGRAEHCSPPPSSQAAAGLAAQPCVCHRPTFTTRISGALNYLLLISIWSCCLASKLTFTAPFPQAGINILHVDSCLERGGGLCSAVACLRCPVRVTLSPTPGCSCKGD